MVRKARERKIQSDHLHRRSIGRIGIGGSWQKIANLLVPQQRPAAAADVALVPQELPLEEPVEAAVHGGPGKISANVVRFRLYRHRFLQENMRFAAFFKIYQILKLKFLKFDKILQILRHLQFFC